VLYGLGDQLDEAFNWLVLILSTIGGSLSQFPELYPLTSPDAKLAILRLMIFPVVILIFLWLWNLLARNVGHQIVVKSFSWIYASLILVTDLAILVFSIYPTLLKALFKGPKAAPIDVIASGLVLFSPFYFSLFFCLFVIRPRMRETYKDSKFLYSLPKQALLFIAAVLLYLFAIGGIEELIFGAEYL